MIRGTTPTHIFDIPFTAAEIKEVKINYAQDDELVLEKHIADCNVIDNQISVTLTQEDTFRFNCKKPVEIQLRILTVTNEVLASIPQTVGVSKCLDTEVLV